MLIVFGHIIVIIGTIILANTLERHRSHGQKERAIMLKVTFFQVLNNVITVSVIVFWPQSTYNLHGSHTVPTQSPLHACTLLTGVCRTHCVCVCVCVCVCYR